MLRALTLSTLTLTCAVVAMAGGQNNSQSLCRTDAKVAEQQIFATTRVTLSNFGFVNPAEMLDYSEVEAAKNAKTEEDITRVLKALRKDTAILSMYNTAVQTANEALLQNMKIESAKTALKAMANEALLTGKWKLIGLNVVDRKISMALAGEELTGLQKQALDLAVTRAENAAISGLHDLGVAGDVVRSEGKEADDEYSKAIVALAEQSKINLCESLLARYVR